ncbi:MAG: hypothetical protein CMM02_05585 [Rhodopirellula sp.]|nr:hypothetical protein [Rhodopirellula sp.]|tara:strand:+ start:24357 stop:25211 length:855 start_codon:yes stop_codon:yes gene_type:complete
MNNKPLVSVGMPIRNGGKYLESALKSITDQTEQNLEIIISDNKSDDGSSKYLKQLSETDDRIKYYCQDKIIRAYDNFRFVLDKANGEYFMWAAHDDTRDLEYIEKLTLELQKNEKAVLAFGDLFINNIDDNTFNKKQFDFDTANMKKISRINKIAFMQCFHIYGLWRTRHVKKIPYSYCSWWPDLPMMLSAGIMGNFIYVPNVNFNYLEVKKTSAERIKYQDMSQKFSLVTAVAAFIFATYNATYKTGGIAVGFYCALLVTIKQIINFPKWIIYRYKLYAKVND